MKEECDKVGMKGKLKKKRKRGRGEQTEMERKM